MFFLLCITTCSHWRRPPVTWKQPPSLALGNDFWETNAGEFPATAGGCSDCWKLLRVAGEAGNVTENVLSILIVLLSIHLQQTET